MGFGRRVLLLVMNDGRRRIGGSGKLLGDRNGVMGFVAVPMVILMTLVLLVWLCL